MSITIICGKPRVGKTALNTCFAIWEMQVNGATRLQRSKEKIEVLNAKYKSGLTAPATPPIYTNYAARFNIGYKQYVEPYRVNPACLCLENEEIPVQYIAPYGELHVTEGQDYWNSRDSAKFPRYVSMWFETHGHFNLDIYIDVQRAKLIDLNIRKLATKIIEVRKMVHTVDARNKILRTAWYCKEFANTQDYETYDSGGYAPYITTRYVYEGNIFENYDSRSCEGDFVPKGGLNFSYLKHLTDSEIAALPESEKKYYLAKKPKEKVNGSE